MKVSIKSVEVDMSLKNNGVEFDVSDNQGAYINIGDVILNETGVIWPGASQRTVAAIFIFLA